MRLIENAVVKTRTAPKFGANDDLVTISQWSPPERFPGAKDSNYRHIQSRGKMHGATVITNRQLATVQYRRELTQRKRYLREFAILRWRRPLSRILKPNDPDRKVCGQAIGYRLKSVFTPLSNSA